MKGLRAIKKAFMFHIPTSLMGYPEKGGANNLNLMYLNFLMFPFPLPFVNEWQPVYKKPPNFRYIMPVPACGENRFGGKRTTCSPIPAIFTCLTVICTNGPPK
jgi:hypothetical protein